METVSSQTPQAQSQLQAAVNTSSSRNFRNWFDEFKAKVSKKSQNNQATNSDQILTSNDYPDKDDTQAPTTTAISTSASFVQAPQPSTAISPVFQARVKSSSLRARKAPKISSANSSDLECSSINMIFNRPKKHQTSIYTNLYAPFGLVIGYLIPFNGTLPWKLICLINSCFAIIVIGLASGSSQTSTALSFCNGFMGGLLVASICFIISGLSFLIHFMPKSPTSTVAPTSKRDANVDDKTLVSDSCFSFGGFDDSTLTSLRDVTIDTRKEQESEDFSQFEILDQENNSTNEHLSTDRQRLVAGGLGDEDYKGWMIEFIGDYEHRNTSEIKLKSIFVRIENRVLYLCKPKSSYDIDTTTLPAISNQRVHDLNNVLRFSVNLLIPKNVRNKQKYVWSKKYPIKLEFQEINSSDNSQKTIQLTLFAKSCREKEEWFRRFKRIFEENRFVHGPTTSTKYLASSKSDETSNNISNSESLFDSLRRFRRRSPSPKRDCVQTSRSSNLLNESKRVIEDIDNKKMDKESESSLSSSSASLVRTKSCELLDSSRPLPAGGAIVEENKQEANENEDEESARDETGADDSTLTRETAELFSQAIEYTNFIESQPTLDYKDYIERVIISGRDATLTSDWFNALTSRIFFDVFSHNYWSSWFKRKIQRKLYRIRLPYFMETLTLTTIDLGTNAPQFLNVVSHSFDACGLSIDFDMCYSGGLTMTFETKLNLLKIKTDNSSRGESSANTTSASSSGTSTAMPNSGAQAESSTTAVDKQPGSIDSQTKESGASTNDSTENIQRDSHLSGSKPIVSSSSASVRTSGGSSTSDSEDGDSDSSSDSSFDEGDANEISDWEDYGAEKTRQNIVKFVDKIASSRYFQHATENRYIKKKLQDISNCPLVLVVQILSLNGVLTLNVPPPQTDRIWYGFKPTPELVLKALPKMGDREVSLSHVTDWIERKLSEEFRKILVIPNMEDIVLPVLKSDHLQYVTATR